MSDAPSADALDAWVTEVYSAIQGEGLLVGVRQAFVRFSGCNIRCDYCDQPESLVRVPTCRIEGTAGSRDFTDAANPLPIEILVRSVVRLRVGRDPWVVATGGEPLVQADAVAKLFAHAKRAGFRTYLETSGILPDALAGVAPSTDFVSMDWKLPSSGRTADHDAASRAFLRGIGGRDGHVKIVVAERTGQDQLESAYAAIAETDSFRTVVLQPVTQVPGSDTPPSPARLLEFQRLGLARLRDVRVIPQTHKAIGQL